VKVAQNWAHIEANFQRVENLSIRGALRLLAGHHGKSGTRY
jgi:hypothetical protein